MLWAERKSPELIINTLEMGILEQVIVLQTQTNDTIISLIKGVTLLFGNCVEDGLIIENLLRTRYGDQIFRNAMVALDQNHNADYDRDELI